MWAAPSDSQRDDLGAEPTGGRHDESVTRDEGPTRICCGSTDPGHDGVLGPGFACRGTRGLRCALAYGRRRPDNESIAQRFGAQHRLPRAAGSEYRRSRRRVFDLSAGCNDMPAVGCDSPSVPGPAKGLSLVLIQGSRQWTLATGDASGANPSISWQIVLPRELTPGLAELQLKGPTLTAQTSL